MLSTPAPEQYTLPRILRITRNKFIVNSVITLLIIAVPLYCLVTTNIRDKPVTWILFLLFVAVLGLSYLATISHVIRLTEDRISYRKWFFTNEMEYTRITAVQFYYRSIGRGGKVPMLELSGENGDKILIDLILFDSPANLWIICDVLKKNARQVALHQTPKEFFAHPGETAWKRNIPPGSYTLPLTLRVARKTFIFRIVVFLMGIGFLLFLFITHPPSDMGSWISFSLMWAVFLLISLPLILPPIRLTEDRISYRKIFFWKTLEYERISAVRFYYLDPVSGMGPVLELSGNAGDTITMSFDYQLISPENLPIIYDVLKKKAGLVALNKSPEEFFAHPDAMVGK
jgi:hypothetical protein